MILSALTTNCQNTLLDQLFEIDCHEKSIVNQKKSANSKQKGQNENFHWISNSSHVKQRICTFLGVDVEYTTKHLRDQKIKEKEGFIGRVTNCQKDKNHNSRS